MKVHNSFGLPQYPMGDARRLILLLGAIDLLERPTLAALADLTSIARDDIDYDIDTLSEQFGVVIHKLGEVYRIDSWGDLLQMSGVRKFMEQRS